MIPQEKKMTPEELLKSFLRMQDHKCVESGEWTPIEFRHVKMGDGSSRVTLPNHDIGFCFAPDGSFEGIYNYKE